MKKVFTTKNLVLMAMFSALAAVLMLWEFPIPFIAPNFYEIDLSEIPILVGSFIMGPVSGVIMEAIKIILKLLIKGTSTAYVGDFANFCVGVCSTCKYNLPETQNKKECLHWNASWNVVHGCSRCCS